MADRDEIVDAIAGFALFADLSDAAARGRRPPLRGGLLPEGERVLRQGLTGSGFYVILDGEAASSSTGRSGHARPRRVLRRGLGPARRAADRRRRGDAAAALPRPRPARRVEAFLVDHPRVMYRMLQAQARRLRSREPMAELSDAPVPARRLSGRRRRQRPGRRSRCRTRCATRRRRTRSSRPTRRRAACSGAGRSSSGCCRGPSRTRRPSAARAPTSATTGTACSARSPSCAAIQPGLMDGTSYFPSRPEMEANLAAFAERAGVAVRYGCRWTATRRAATRTATGSCSRPPTGEYRCRVLVFAVGVAEPYTPPAPGMELAVPLRGRPAGRDLRRSGGSSSSASRTPGFELATGLLPWARQLMLASPSPAKLSVDTKSLVGVRARYVQPYEDHVLGGGVTILDAAIDRIERSGGRRARGPPAADRRRRATSSVEVDDVISATGFMAPLRDLPDLGVATFGQSRLPVQTPWWESATVPGIYLRRDASARARRASRSTACRRTPARSTAPATTPACWPRTWRETQFGVEPERPHVAPDASHRASSRPSWPRRPSSSTSAGTWRRVLTVDPAGGIPRRGHPAARPRARRGRAGRARGDARGRRIRRHLPGRLHAHRAARWPSTRSSRTRSCASTRSMLGAPIAEPSAG